MTLKEAAVATRTDSETLRGYCVEKKIHAHRMGGKGVWFIEVTAVGFAANAPSEGCSCLTPTLHEDASGVDG